MSFNKYLKALAGRLIELQKRQVSGVLRAGVEIQRGKPERGDCRFYARNVLQTEAAEHESPSKKFDVAYQEAHRLESQFFGRLEIEYYLSAGVVVDSRHEIKQTFVFRGP